MTTEDQKGDNSSPSNNEKRAKSGGRTSRPPGARRPRRRSTRSSRDNSSGKGEQSESRQVEEQSLGPGHKKRIFKRRRSASEKDEQSPEKKLDETDGGKRSRRSRGRNRSKSGNVDGKGSGDTRASKRTRSRSESGKSDANRSRGHRNDRSRKRGESQGRDRSRNDDLHVSTQNAPDGTFTGDMYTDLDPRTGNRPQSNYSANYSEEVVSADVSFFSSKNGQDFASMDAGEIDFLKPHDADENEMYLDMPTLDVTLKPKGELMDIVGVKTHRSGTIDPFDCENLILQKGDEVIVETERGLAIGEVMMPTTRRYVSREVPRVFRTATRNDMRQRERNLQKAAEAFELCQKSITTLKLFMKLVEVMYLHGGNKAVFYFMAEGRVDFRQLVKDLAKELHIRVEMRQIGVRDASRMIGGLGTCGLSLCCSRYIREFAPVSIRMAKDQDLVLNPEKVSGQCGRLMCCLAYEEEVYKEKGKKMPRVGKMVETTEGCGRVRDRDILRGLVRVELESEPGLKTFELTDIRPLKNPNDGQRDKSPHGGDSDSGKSGNRRGRGRGGADKGESSRSESRPESNNTKETQATAESEDAKSPQDDA